MNGNTTEDRTQYYNNIPSNQVEVALWLEADRMGYLLDSLTEKKFENQRATVKNEKFQNQENQPYGMVGELLGQTLYPYGHPYSWPVIGYVDDLNRATINDVKNFFLRWYGPNNAILTISGDVDVKQTLAWVEKYFGSIKPGPEVKRIQRERVTLADNKYASYYDKIYMPLSVRTFPTVPAFHKDEPALDCLADMMGDGNNSIFYKNFVKTEKAEATQVIHSCKALAGEFSIYISAFPPTDEASMEDPSTFDKLFKEIESKTLATIDTFEKRGFTEDALQRVKAKRKSSIISGIESSYGKAALLSDWAYLLDRPFNINDDIERYNKVTLDDVKRVFDKYIKKTGAAVVNVYPAFSEKDSVKSNNPYAGKELKNDPEYANLVFNPLADTPESWKQPIPQPPKIVSVPEFYTSTLKNQIKVIGTQSSKAPIIIIALNIDGGNLTLNSDDLKKNGIAELTAELLNEGTTKYTTEQISAELDKLGSTISFSANKTSTRVYVSCLKENLDATLKLLEEKLFHPRFDEKDFTRVKKQYREFISQRKTNPDYIARTAFSSALYGNSIWGVNPSKKNIDKIELKDIKSYYEKNYSSSSTRCVIVGNISKDEILPKLEFLNQWSAKPVKLNTTVKSENIEPQILVVDKIGAPSSILLLGQPSLPFDATGDFFKNYVSNFVLGGSFNSRLNLNLREEKGYTYGIRSGFTGDRYKGEFYIQAAVKKKETANSLVEILKEYSNYLINGISDSELEFTKNSVLNGQALEYETSFQKAIFLDKICEFNLPKNYPVQQAELLRSMTKTEINNQIKKLYQPNNSLIIIVGDKVAIKQQLESTSYNTVNFTPKLNIHKIKILTVD